MPLVASRSVPAALVAALLVSLTTGCSGDDDDYDTSTVQCNALAPSQIVPVTVEYGGTPLPGTGGAIPEGSYVLTAMTAYVPQSSTVLPRCNGFADALVLSNGTFDHAVVCYFEAENPQTVLGRGNYAGSYSLSETELSFDYQCPGPKVETFAYSAEPPNLRMLVPDSTNALTTELVWTLE